jgi:hypothetical protein
MTPDFLFLLALNWDAALGRMACYQFTTTRQRFDHTSILIGFFLNRYVVCTAIRQLKFANKKPIGARILAPIGSQVSSALT